MTEKRNKKGQFTKDSKPSPKAKAANKKALIGNQLAKKLTTAELKKEAYEQYCDWLRKGNPKRGWVFKHPEMTLTFKTMDKYIRENPNDFPAITLEAAKAEGYMVWLNDGKKMMTGVIEKCQPAIYQMMMRNIWGWDKENHDDKETTEPLITTLSKMWRK
jgi:hypothetical protein